MPSPFPGMDPYLEGELWSGFHHELTVQAKYQLVPKLEPRYFALTEKYFLMESEDEVVIATSWSYPDLAITKGIRGRGTGTGTATLVAPVQVEAVLPRPTPHFRIEIRDLKKRRLVTAIEFLSPVPLLLEYEEVCKRLVGQIHLSENDIDAVLDYLCQVAHHQSIFYLWRPFSSDPGDDKVVELAVAAGCDHIVSFNLRDLRGVEQFGIQAMKPQDFLRKIGDLP